MFLRDWPNLTLLFLMYTVKPNDYYLLLTVPSLDANWPTTCSYRKLFIVMTTTFSLYSTPQIQLYGFNKELYHNMSEAQHKAQGIVGISLMVQIGDTPNPELRIITSTFNKVLYKGL